MLLLGSGSRQRTHRRKGWLGMGVGIAEMQEPAPGVTGLVETLRPQPRYRAGGGSGTQPERVAHGDTKHPLPSPIIKVQLTLRFLREAENHVGSLVPEHVAGSKARARRGEPRASGQR